MFKLLFAPEGDTPSGNVAPITTGTNPDDFVNFDKGTQPDEAVKETDKPTPDEDEFNFNDLDKATDDDDTEESDVAEEDKETTEETPEPEIEEEGLTEDEKKALESRPTLTDIKKKYPTIFKDFPELKHVLYREGAYSELFPSVQEAKVAANKAEVLSGVESALFEKADAKGILDVVLKQDKKAFEGLVANILPAIQELDGSTFLEIIKPVLKQVARSMKANGLNRKDTNLQYAADHLHYFVFQDQNIDSDYEPTIAKKSKPSPELEEFENKKKDFENRQLDTSVKDINSRLNKRLTKAIEQSLIKVGASLNEYTRETITSKTVEKVLDAIGKDQAFKRQLGGLVNDLRKSGYSEDSKVRILTAYLTRAKSLIPNIQKAEISKALGGRTVDKEKSKPQSPTRIGPSSRPGTGKPSLKKEDMRNMSEEELLFGRK